MRRDGGTTGTDDDIAARSFENLGAWIMGRNIFGPVRGPGPDHEWKGWRVANPPYHVPVFVLTHHPRRCWRWRVAPLFISSKRGLTRRWISAGGRSREGCPNRR